MEDFKNTNTPVIREEIYDKIFRKDKLNIVYSEPGRGAGFLCKNLITKLKKEIPNLKVIEAIDAQSVQKVLRDLSDDVYAIKRLKEKEVSISSPVLYFIDVTDVRSTNILNSILDLYDRNIIQTLNIYIILKSVHRFILSNIRSSENNNFSIIRFIDETYCLQINNSGPLYNLYVSKNINVSAYLDECSESLKKDEESSYENISKCRDIIRYVYSNLISNEDAKNKLKSCSEYLLNLHKKLSRYCSEKDAFNLRKLLFKNISVDLRDKSGLIYGCPNSGKTTIIKNIIEYEVGHSEKENLDIYLIDPKQSLRDKFSQHKRVYYLDGRKTILQDYSLEAFSILKKIERVMKERSDIFSQKQFDNIMEYNHENKEKLPYIQIFIEEIYTIYAELENTNLSEEFKQTILYLLDNSAKYGINLYITTHTISNLFNKDDLSKFSFIVDLTASENSVKELFDTEDIHWTMEKAKKVSEMQKDYYRVCIVADSARLPLWGWVNIL